MYEAKLRALNEAQRMQRIFWRRLPAVLLQDGAEPPRPVVLALSKTAMHLISSANTPQVRLTTPRSCELRNDAYNVSSTAYVGVAGMRRRSSSRATTLSTSWRSTARAPRRRSKCRRSKRTSSKSRYGEGNLTDIPRRHAPAES